MPLFNYHSVLISVPSQAPSELTLSATSSASIAASWRLPPAYSRHGIIVGFKLFYKKKGLRSIRVETINGGTTFSAGINGLDNYTEYEFQVLAFTSHGDGPKSSVVVERTLKDGKKFDCLCMVVALPLLLVFKSLSYCKSWVDMNESAVICLTVYIC